MNLLAALASALVSPDVSGDLCVSCGAPVTSHFRRLRWVGCAEQEPEPQAREDVRLPRLLYFPARGVEVHDGSVAQGGGDAARCEVHQSERT